MGTVPLAVYHVPSAPPAGMDGDYSAKPPEAGFVIPSTNTALPPLPESHLYPNLRKICMTLILFFHVKDRMTQNTNDTILLIKQSTRYFYIINFNKKAFYRNNSFIKIIF